MTMDEAKQQAKGRLGEYLSSLGVDVDKAKGGNDKCPICGSGTHRKGTGAFHYYAPDRWKCFSCGKGGDIFDLYAELNGGNSRSGEVMRAVYEMLGITIDGFSLQGKDQKHNGSERNMKSEQAQAAEYDEPKADYSAFYEKCAAALAGSEGAAYLEGRGIPVDFAARYGIGYAADFLHPAWEGDGKTHRPTKRLVIPASGGSFVARSIEDGITPKVMNAGKTEAFNGAACVSGGDKPLYIVEGWANALSIELCGGSAVAIGGAVSGVRSFLDAYAPTLKIQGRRVILALDNDATGENGIKALTDSLTAAGVAFLVDKPQGECNDANDALRADKAAFSSRLMLTAAAWDARKKELDGKDEADYRAKESASAFAADFLYGIETGRELIPSGFKWLDRVIAGSGEGQDGGGLPVGLYVIGGKSGCGKTTFILQIADQIAAAGRDVMIFSLEMRRAELIGKSISRLSYLLATKAHPQLGLKLLGGYAFSWGDIRDLRYKQARGWLDLSSEESIKAAADEYFGGIGRRVFIHEGRMDGTSMDYVREKVEAHRRLTGKAPVVFIDYLQMLAAPAGSEGGTDKALTDKKILACKVMSGELDTPVFVISSLNRGGYNRAMCFEAFKESGGIEYSADVVIGLQRCGMEKATGKDGDTEGAKIEAQGEADERESGTRHIQAKILKNRSGGKAAYPSYTFVPRYNYFLEDETPYSEQAR